MANCDVLYMKGMHTEGSDDEMEENIWDDRKLTDAYDKAIKLANLEVAKRVAMSTNSSERNKSEDASQPQPQSGQSKSKSKKPKQSKPQKKDNKREEEQMWKVGMGCRAVYDVDGFEYEATLISIIDDDQCVIRYLGYNNTEVVPISSLQPTLGKEARRSQVLEATNGDEEAYFEQANCVDDGRETYQGAPRRDCPETPQFRKYLSAGTRNARNRRTSRENCFPMPGFGMPDATMLKEFGQMDMPIPPPPLVGGAFADPCADDNALSNMLVSWYMSGYYTGLYQGRRRSCRSSQQ